MSKICRDCEPKLKWWPIEIDFYSEYLGKLIINSTEFKNAYELKKNIGYNLQHMEFLIKSLNELNMTSVIVTQTYKSIVITGIGIIEAILYYVIRINNYHRENYWKLLRSVTTNEFKSEKDVLKLENLLFRKLPEPVEEEMSLDSMLKKVESKKLLGDDHTIYARLNYLRKLRNKVHLHLIERKLDTDWNNFNKKDKNNMLEVLAEVLFGDLFRPTEKEKEIFYYLTKK